jgi:PAS domain S-box-containing protein
MTRTNRRSREAGQSAAATADGGRASGAHDSPVTAGGRASIVEALRHSERRYRSLFDNLLNGYAHCRMILDEQGRPVDFVYQDVNAAFERLTGLKDVVGKPVSETIPGLREASPQLFASYARVAASGEPETFEVEIESLGMWLFISAYGTEPGYFDAVFENITERKRAEKELRESQGQLREAHRLADSRHRHRHLDRRALPYRGSRPDASRPHLCTTPQRLCSGKLGSSEDRSREGAGDRRTLPARAGARPPGRYHPMGACVRRRCL